MDKRYIMNMAKKDMVSMIQQLELPDIDEKRKLINRYFDLLETLNDLDDEDRHDKDENSGEMKESAGPVPEADLPVSDNQEGKAEGTR